MNKTLKSYMDKVVNKNPEQVEFHQAVKEVLESIWGFLEDNPHYLHANILDRLIEPERVIIFRVPWRDDKGHTQVNRGFRVEFNSSIGPYKGGLRFHPSVNLGILKFLGFEQVFKNSLTTLPMGGGKGGSDFDPKGKSDNEIMSFCQSFMSELYRHIGSNTDIPAGDIGVGGREIGYLFGQYKKITNRFSGVLTGKGINWGGSLIRPEATGYGAVYFAQEMLNTKKLNFSNKKVLISGAGNVAQYAAEKIIQLGGKILSMSDSSGTVYDKDGIDNEKLSWIMNLKNVKRGRIKEFAQEYNVDYLEGEKPWGIKCDIAIPCATQNEIDEDDASTLIKNGCVCVVEGANMPTTYDATEYLIASGVLFGPGKAANAGGVAVSGLEMSQNSLRLSWTRAEVDEKLYNIMIDIHAACVQYGKDGDGYVDYVKGANVAGFVKVAEAMMAQGVV